jgi:hypothetical protein
MRTARRSFGKPYLCLQEWPENCFIQCGGSGIVFSKDNIYDTAFFEAFPRDPDCFLRGEGESVEDAEKECFKKYQRVLNCQGHEFEPRGRDDGYGYCIHCPLSQSDVLKPAFNCIVCDVPCYGYTDKEDKQYCKKHYYDLDISEALEELSTEDEERDRFSFFSKKRQMGYFKKNKQKLRIFQENNLPIEGKEFRELDNMFRHLIMKVEEEFMELKGIKSFMLPSEYDDLIISKYSEIVQILLDKN